MPLGSPHVAQRIRTGTLQGLPGTCRESSPGIVAGKILGACRSRTEGSRGPRAEPAEGMRRNPMTRALCTHGSNPRIAATKTLQLATKKKGPNFKTGMTL